MTPEALQWVRDGRATVIPSSLVEGFVNYERALPWSGGSFLDWSRMPPSTRINISTATQEQETEWWLSTAIGMHDHVVVFYSGSSGGILVRNGLRVSDLDELYWKASGVRFAFGVDVRDTLVPAYGDLLEYGKGDVLTAVARLDSSVTGSVERVQ